MNHIEVKSALERLDAHILEYKRLIQNLSIAEQEQKLKNLSYARSILADLLAFFNDVDTLGLIKEKIFK